MFGNIMNEETDHWNPMSSNPIIPPNSVQDHIDLENEGEEDAEGNGEENDDDISEEILEVSPTPSNKPKRNAHIILEKPNKKPKTSTGIVIQANMTKIRESAQTFVVDRFEGISIDESWVMSVHLGLTLGVMRTLWQLS
jgi:hypothetical protein